MHRKHAWETAMLARKKKEITSDWRTFQISHQAISCIICKSIKVRFQRMDKTKASFFYENDTSFVIADSSSFARMRRKHEICQTISFSKLQSPFLQTIILGAPWPSTQVNWVTCSSYSCYCFKKIGVTGHLWTLRHHLLAYICTRHKAAPWLRLCGATEETRTCT